VFDAFSSLEIAMLVCVEKSAISSGVDRRAETPLSARVRHRLQQSSYQAVRRINVLEHEGVLTLYGNVASFYLKQIAQETAAKVPGVDQVHNRVQVSERVH